MINRWVAGDGATLLTLAIDDTRWIEQRCACLFGCDYVRVRESVYVHIE